MQFGDPAPHVNGDVALQTLDTAIARGRVRDAASLEIWTSDWLRESVAPFDGVIVASVCRAALRGDFTEIERANEIAAASLLAPSQRRTNCERDKQRDNLSRTPKWLRREADSVSDSETDWIYSVIFGVFAATAGAEPAEALATFLSQAAQRMVAAGVRGIPLPPAQAQKILTNLHDTIDELSDRYSQQPLETAGSGGPHYLSLRDERPRLSARLFRS